MFAEVIVPFRWENVRSIEKYQSLVLTDEDAYALNVAQGLDRFLSKAQPNFLMKASLTQATTTRRSSHQ